MDDNGAAYTLDGRSLSEEEIQQVDWREGNLPWSHIKMLQDKREQALQNKDRYDQP